MQGLEELVAVVEHGSLSAASRALGVPRPTLSRRLDRLEEELGVRLVHRTTRRLTLSREGEVLYDRAKHLVRGVRDAVEEVRRLDGTPRGLLRVAVPTELPQEVVSGWLKAFLDVHPEVQLEWIAIDGPVDVRAEFDVALSADADLDPSLVVRTLSRNARIAVASVDYLALRGTPRVPGDLADHAIIRGVDAGGAAETSWPLRSGGTVPVRGAFVANQHGMQIQAARRGLGVALVFDGLVTAELASGELVHVVRDVGRDQRACLVYADRRFLDPKVRAFVDHFVASVPDLS
ncbi:MAG: LysR family transcriptional regulator [Proteobacteria bacterium]|nr:LysR family transcriptional regulator [Pseudomonadota bacterium]MCP4917368.1 LysR family transcriptional regulator [Pseudomonadota bacterium]